MLFIELRVKKKNNKHFGVRLSFSQVHTNTCLSSMCWRLCKFDMVGNTK